MSGTTGGPYPGPRPFRREESDRFFGRAADTAALAELWQANRLTVAFGPVASGKTSLLQAGVFPAIANKRVHPLPAGRISYGVTFPFAALPEHNPYTLALLRSWSPGEPVTRLAGLSVPEFIRSRAERQAGTILAPIDQVEELLVDSGPRRVYRQRFLDEVAQALQDEPRLHVLLVVREEALGSFSAVLGSGARHRVTPLSARSAVAAVTGPVAGTGRSYDLGAAEKLVAELQTNRVGPAGGQHEPGQVEPALLQIVCARLWAAVPSDLAIITASDLRRYADVDAVLAAYYGQVIAEVADYHDLSAARLRSWLLHTFVTDRGARGIASEGATHTVGMPNAVVRALEDRHLLSAQCQSGSRRYELLSDRLIAPLRQAADEWRSPAEPNEYLRAAERALTLGELEDAKRHAEATLRNSPQSDFRLRAEAESLLGNLAHEREKLAPGREKAAEAESRYRDAAGLFEAVSDTAAVARELAAVGQMLLAQGRFADAVHELRAAVDRAPNDPVMQTELGRALWQLGEGRAAVDILTAVLGVDGSNAEARRVRGEILADLGDARNAIRDLDRVTLLERPATRAARGLALADLGEQAAASREIEDAVAEAPRNGPVLLYGARVMARGGDLTTAEELARRAVDAMDPALPPPHRETALQLAGRKDERPALD